MHERPGRCVPEASILPTCATQSPAISISWSMENSYSKNRELSNSLASSCPRYSRHSCSSAFCSAMLPLEILSCLDTRDEARVRVTGCALFRKKVSCKLLVESAALLKSCGLVVAMEDLIVASFLDKVAALRSTTCIATGVSGAAPCGQYAVMNKLHPQFQI